MTAAEVLSGAFGPHEVPRWPFLAIIGFGLVCVTPRAAMALSKRHSDRRRRGY